MAIQFGTGYLTDLVRGLGPPKRRTKGRIGGFSCEPKTADFVTKMTIRWTYKK